MSHSYCYHEAEYRLGRSLSVESVHTAALRFCAALREPYTKPVIPFMSLRLDDSVINLGRPACDMLMVLLQRADEGELRLLLREQLLPALQDYASMWECRWATCCEREHAHFLGAARRLIVIRSAVGRGFIERWERIAHE